MNWELLGYEEFPFSVNPISGNTICLFTGHAEEVRVCDNVLQDKNVRLVIEGARGVGTTSFANYLKFSAQKKKLFFSPQEEVSVESNWNLESLLTAIISTIICELEIAHKDKLRRNKVFIEAKSLAHRLSEAYNNFGVSAFSLGGSYGKSVSVTQPTFIPATTLGHHLRDLGQLVVKLGYKNGILVQLNNLDLNVVHTEEHLQYLFNAIRDYLQIDNISWLLVGDVGIRSFIARKVDRLDDIISYDLFIKPLTKSLYHELIKKRLEYYQVRKNAKFPLGRDTFDYIYDVADGRLRYIFGLIHTLINKLQIGKLIQTIKPELAVATISELAKERMRKFDLSKAETSIIEALVKLDSGSVSELAKHLGRNRTYISKVINSLYANNLVSVKKEGTNRIYYPLLDAKIAYSGK